MRRCIDILIAVVALLLLCPLLLMIAIAIMIDSPGGPLYLGWRVGRNGAPFRMWKLRTMVRSADLSGCITGRRDPRVTRLGDLLRRTKLDEVPQFVNLLLGHMTLVGPRPESPDMVALYTPAQRAVLEVKPGVTGKAQLEAAEESETIPEGVAADEYYARYLLEPKIRRDLGYLAARTWRSDAKIVLATAIYVLRSSLRMRQTETTDAQTHSHEAVQ